MVKRLQLLEREFDAKVKFLTDSLRLSTRDEITELREQVKKLNFILHQKDKSLQQEKNLNRRNVEQIQVLIQATSNTTTHTGIETKEKLQKLRPVSKSLHLSRKKKEEKEKVQKSLCRH